MKIAILSLADINNYGDVFFPVVIKKELIKRLPKADIDIITNTLFECEFYQTKEYCYQELEQYDAIIMGGGELISPYDNEAFKQTYGYSYNGTPSDIAFGWLDIKKAIKVWFDVGIHPVLLEYPDNIIRALNSLDYLSVRGTISKKVLERDFRKNYSNIRVMPDLGWMFPSYIDRYSDLGLIDNCDKNLDFFSKEYCVFQAIHDINIETNIQYIANVLVDFQQQTGVQVILLPIMQTVKQWGEYEIMEGIYNASCQKLLLIPYGLNIMQTGLILKNAKFFVGSSLHGAITSLAYGKPTVSIRDESNTKMQDLHASRFRSACFANSWEVLPGVLKRLNHEADNTEDGKYAMMYSEYMQYRIGKEFDGLVSRLNGL